MSQENERSKRDREEEHDKSTLESESRSPRSKKEKCIKKMTTWKDKSPEYEMIMATAVINILESNVENENTIKLIECYNTIYREEVDMLMEDMIKCCNKWENKEEKIREAIRYVWPENNIDLESINEVEKLAEHLVSTIETLMPKKCKECDAHYMVAHEDNPIVRCMWCKVGAHDCIDRGNKEKIKGMTWMCKLCTNLIDKQILPKIDLVKKMELIRKETTINFEGFEKKKNNDGKIVKDLALEIVEVIKDGRNNNSNKENNSSSGSSSSKVSDEQMRINEGDEDISSYSSSSRVRDEQMRVDEGDEIFIRKITEIVKKELEEKKNEQKPKKDTNNEVEKKEVCWFWENRSCRYESNCKKDHPELCKSTMEMGECNVEGCKKLHRKTCRNMIHGGFCNRGDSCWFVHPTKRINNQQNNNQNPGYINGNKPDIRRQQESFNQDWNHQNQFQNYANNSFCRERSE